MPWLLHIRAVALHETHFSRVDSLPLLQESPADQQQRSISRRKYQHYREVRTAGDGMVCALEPGILCFSFSAANLILRRSRGFCAVLSVCQTAIAGCNVSRNTILEDASAQCQDRSPWSKTGVHCLHSIDVRKESTTMCLLYALTRFDSATVLVSNCDPDRHRIDLVLCSLAVSPRLIRGSLPGCLSGRGVAASHRYILCKSADYINTLRSTARVDQQHESCCQHSLLDLYR